MCMLYILQQQQQKGWQAIFIFNNNNMHHSMQKSCKCVCVDILDFRINIKLTCIMYKHIYAINCFIYIQKVFIYKLYNKKELVLHKIMFKIKSLFNIKI